MHTIINDRISGDDQNGTIRVKIHRALQQPSIEDKERAVMEYLDVLMELSLISSKSNEHYINDHVPDQGILEIIQGSVAEILNPNITARLYDVLQVNKKNKFANAKLALQGYLNLAELRPELSAKRDYLQRIISILKGLGKGNQLLLPVYFNRILEYISQSNINTECYTVTKLTSELIGLNSPNGIPESLIQKIKDGLEQFRDDHEYRNYRLCHEDLSLLIPNNAVFHSIEAARSYIMEADHFSLTPNASQHRIAALYKKALLRFHFHEIKGEELDLLEKKLVKAQQAAAEQVQLFGCIDPIEIKDNPHLKLPDFENVYQAVYWLIDVPLISKKKIVEDLESKKESFFHLQRMSAVMTNAKGNTIDASEDNSKLAYKDAALFRQIYCKSIIWKMYGHFSDNQSISEMEVYELIARSKFIPKERLSIYTRGLYHGFRGDFLEAVHILVPQIENCLRHILNTHGKITAKLAEELQKEMSLQSYFNHLRTILHEDLILELEGLLNEAFGENLRNNLAHGLAETSIFNDSYIGLHTWWLALKLSLDIERFIIKNVKTDSENDAEILEQ